GRGAARARPGRRRGARGRARGRRRGGRGRARRGRRRGGRRERTGGGLVRAEIAARDAVRIAVHRARLPALIGRDGRAVLVLAAGGIAGVARGAGSEQGHRRRRAAVVLERAQVRVDRARAGADLVTAAGGVHRAVGVVPDQRVALGDEVADAVRGAAGRGVPSHHRVATLHGAPDAP